MYKASHATGFWVAETKTSCQGEAPIIVGTVGICSPEKTVSAFVDTKSTVQLVVCGLLFHLQFFFS